MAAAVEDEGFTQEDYGNVVKRLHILGFHIDRKGENIVSEIDGVIAFVDKRYYGERVNVGDVWLCSAVFRNTVYYVQPLKKITSSMIMGLSDDIRNGVVDSLWRTNRAEFVKIFEERYKEQIYSQAYKEANEKNETIVKELEGRIADLSKQVEHSRMVITMKGPEDDGIELTSDEVAVESVDLEMEPVRPQVREERLPAPWTQSSALAPGMPEVRLAEAPVQAQHVRLRVERVSEETIRCDAFEDGKYFVHINPSKRFLVIRRHDYGSAICVGGRIRLDGLGAYSTFTGKAPLMAEYNQRYGGVLVYL